MEMQIRNRIVSMLCLIVYFVVKSDENFKLSNYIESMHTEYIFPTIIGTLKTNFSSQFNTKLSNLAINKYHDFVKNNPNITQEKLNNHFFYNQAKCDLDFDHQTTRVDFWPELYKTEEYTQLKKIAMKGCIEYLRHSKLQIEMSELHYQASLCIWASVYENGTNHSTHIHENALCSGVYYSKIPENQRTPLIFSDPRGFTVISKDELYDKNSVFEPQVPFHLQYYYFPKEGDMIFFPSFVPHMVPKHHGNKARVVFAFNLEV